MTEKVLINLTGPANIIKKPKPLEVDVNLTWAEVLRLMNVTQATVSILNVRVKLEGLF